MHLFRRLDDALTTPRPQSDVSTTPPGDTFHPPCHCSPTATPSTDLDSPLSSVAQPPATPPLYHVLLSGAAPKSMSCFVSMLPFFCKLIYSAFALWMQMPTFWPCSSALFMGSSNMCEFVSDYALVLRSSLADRDLAVQSNSAQNAFPRRVGNSKKIKWKNQYHSLSLTHTHTQISSLFKAHSNADMFSPDP
ncbi:unnamed protein product [Protopolystoma xenopodis]|uniref:Uncharacterized protein n=1 Tax=Protopolystoma xenopodis TaxID=117903 RepID=A0A3S5FBV1_9PLAT|nr:unnamed protein product [Protopolystoma xenopodis]